MDAMEMTSTGLSTVIYIEILGAIIGVFLTIAFIKISLGIGGTIKNAIYNLIAGVVLFTSAFIYSAINDVLELHTMNISMSVHMTLMILAMIMMALAAYKFAKLSK